MRVLARATVFLGLLIAFAAHAQSGVAVELDEVIDNRVSAGPFVGSLDLRVKVTGSSADKASGARIVVKEAKDDRGTLLADAASSPPDFMPREYNSGTLQISLKSPTRAASSVRVKGNVELFLPARDPNAVVKIDKAFSKLDVPLSSKALKTAKIEITPLSLDGYRKMRESRKIDAKKIEEIRAEGKKRGVPENEIEAVIGLAQAFDSMDADVPEGAIILSGKKASFDRIFRVEVLGSDGKPINVGNRSTSTRGEDSVMTLQPSEPPPANATLQLYLLTDKSKVSTPFELKVTLP